MHHFKLSIFARFIKKNPPSENVTPSQKLVWDNIIIRRYGFLFFFNFRHDISKHVHVGSRSWRQG